LVHTGDGDKPAVHGLARKRQQPRLCGWFECTIRVDRLAITTATSASGARILMATAPVPRVGVPTKFEDTEASMLGAVVYEQEPPTLSNGVTAVVPGQAET